MGERCRRHTEHPAHKACCPSTFRRPWLCWFPTFSLPFLVSPTERPPSPAQSWAPPHRKIRGVSYDIQEQNLAFPMGLSSPRQDAHFSQSPHGSAPPACYGKHREGWEVGLLAFPSAVLAHQHWVGSRCTISFNSHVPLYQSGPFSSSQKAHVTRM